MTIVISLAIQGPLLPGTAIGTLGVIIIAARGRRPRVPDLRPISPPGEGGGPAAAHRAARSAPPGR